MFKKIGWKNLFIVSVLIPYTYLFMEWLFFVTKPSFLNGYSFYDNLVAILVPAGIISAVALTPLVLAGILNKFIRNPNLAKFSGYLTAGFLALIISSLILILIDNFTYTLFKFGVVSTTGILRVLYAFGFVFLIYKSFRWVLSFASSPQKPDFFLWLLGGILILSAALFVEQFINHRPASATEETAFSANLPNIILIGSDGMNANNMSVYGYERETTPFLSQIQNSFLIAENGFSNWNGSAASTTSMLTGKTPQDLDLYKYTHILKGEDAYQHLPGILRRYGYYSIQFGALVYVDAYASNLQEAFDLSNGRSIDQSLIFRAARKLGQLNAGYFSLRLAERITDRLAHIFFINLMSNPFSEINFGGEQVTIADDRKMKELVELITKINQPVFAHVHLLGTHGAGFRPKIQHFSAGEEQISKWMLDFYDDSILTFDGYMQMLYEELERSGELANTLIIIYSDHGMIYTNQRLPIILHFPGDEYSGKLKNNVQNLDIPTTILDYLNIPTPSWMTGVSLIEGEPPQNRIAVTMETLGTMHVSQCEHEFWLGMDENTWFVGEFENHTNPCHSEILSLADIPTEVVNFYATTYQLNQDELPVTVRDIGALYPDRTRLIKTIFQRMGMNIEEIPPAIGLFADLPASQADAGLLEFAYAEGFLLECDLEPLKICPEMAATREEAALAVIRGLWGEEHIPPPATGIFEDVYIGSPYAPWIEEMYRMEITPGCSSDPMKYCPYLRFNYVELDEFITKALTITK